MRCVYGHYQASSITSKISLLTRRSFLSPISRIPLEILTRIFHFLALEEPPCSDEQGLGWIRATHVCRLWRLVALGDSTLWARIVGLPTDTELMLISEMLARAANAPLDIDIDLEEVSSVSRPEVLHMFRPHLSHTRELRLHSLSKEHSDGVRDIYSQEAPTLEHFQVDVSTNSYIPFRELGGTTLFKGRAPKLRTIILSQVLIPWSLIPRGQLTQLTIGFLFEVSVSDVPSYGDLNQLIDLLVNSPELEVLVLGCCLPSRLSRFPHGRTIDLPRLSRLCLAGSSSRIMNLLKMLRFPSSAMLHCHCVSENTPTHNDHLLLPVVSAHLQSPSPVEFKNLNVVISRTNRSLEVTASTTLPTSGIRQPQGFESDTDEEEFILSFDGLPEHGSWTDIIVQVCKMLPISNLEILSISASNVLDRVNLVELLKRCTKVSAMQAVGRGTSALVRALTTSKATNTADPKPTGKGKKKRHDSKDSTPAQPTKSTAAPAPLFPKLTFLSLKRQDFAEINHPSGILFDVVENGLRQRKVEYCAPLKMLRIEECAISARRTKALQKLVQDFRWDRKKSFPDEPEGVRADELNDEDDSDSDEPARRPWWEDLFDDSSKYE